MKVWLLYQSLEGEGDVVIRVFDSFWKAVGFEKVERDKLTEDDGSCSFTFRIVPKEVE